MREATFEDIEADRVLNPGVRRVTGVGSRSEMEGEFGRLVVAASRMATSVLEELGADCRGSGLNDDSDADAADPHQTLDDVREVLLRGEELSRVAWGANAMVNRKCYIVDEGHVVTVKPKESAGGGEDGGGSRSVDRVKAFLDLWMDENQWFARQAEVSERCDRHGEVFDLIAYDRDGMVRVYFAEPYDLEEDPRSPYQDTEDTSAPYIDEFGVRRTNNLRYLPVRYFVDGDWYDDLSYRVLGIGRPAGIELSFGDLSGRSLVQHRKRNVLRSANRGLTLYWSVRDELTWSKRLLSNLMRVSSFQAAFGAIRTISDIHSADAVKSYLGTLQGGSGSSGDSEKFDFPSAAVVTVPKSVKYEFPETGLGQSNHIEVLVQLLRACAAGLRVPEYMLTANVSEGNFASTLVSEGPFHKSMRFEQNQMVQEDMRILKQALWYAASSGEFDLTLEDVESVVLEVKKPRVQTRNRKEDFEINQKLWESSLLSGKDHLGQEGLDYRSQQAQIERERAEEHAAPAALSPTMGPDPSIQADALRERGVMKGEPAEDPTKE